MKARTDLASTLLWRLFIFVVLWNFLHAIIINIIVEALAWIYNATTLTFDIYRWTDQDNRCEGLPLDLLVAEYHLCRLLCSRLPIHWSRTVSKNHIFLIHVFLCCTFCNFLVWLYNSNIIICFIYNDLFNLLIVAITIKCFQIQPMIYCKSHVISIINCIIFLTIKKLLENDVPVTAC